MFGEDQSVTFMPQLHTERVEISMVAQTEQPDQKLIRIFRKPVTTFVPTFFLGRQHIQKNELANFTMLTFKCQKMVVLVLTLEAIFFAQSKLRNYVSLWVQENQISRPGPLQFSFVHENDIFSSWGIQGISRFQLRMTSQGNLPLTFLGEGLLFIGSDF